MSSFIKLMNELRTFAQRADVYGECRISISFDSPSDKARFAAEVQRDLKDITRVPWNDVFSFYEGTIAGIKVRIL